MHIIDLITGERRLVYVLPVEDNDFKKITVKHYSFNWRKLKGGTAIYKLTLTEGNDILGLIALLDCPEEERTEIKLLAVSAENIGHEKQYERIVGCLIAFAGREALRKFSNYPALSLIPKTEIRQHYINKYGMNDAGWQLFLEGIPLLHLLNEYLS